MISVRQFNETQCSLDRIGAAFVLRLVSEDGTNRLTRARVTALTAAIEGLAANPPSHLVITGNAHFFSAGADLREIAALTGPEAFRFAQMGQRLMNAVANFPSPTIAAYTDIAWVEDSIWPWRAIAVSPGRMRCLAIAAQP